MQVRAFLPNTVTFLNLFCGFFSIYLSFEGEIAYAAMAIMLATVFDMLDGRLARILNVNSLFGKELDSFSDLVTFGLAPAFMFFNLIKVNSTLPMIVQIIIAFVYVITATARLALYNSKTGENDTIKYFSGMPSTFAGISLATIFSFNYLPSFTNYYFKFTFPFPFWAQLIVFLIYAFLMVSKISYPKATGRVLNFKGTVNILFNLGFFFFLFFALKYFLLVIVIIYTLCPIWSKKK